MNRYRVIILTPDHQRSFETVVFANTDYDARSLAEQQYGAGSVMSYTLITE